MEECHALKKQCMDIQEQFDQYRNDYVSYWDNYQMLLEILCHSVDDLQGKNIIDATPEEPLPEQLVKTISPRVQIPDGVTFAADGLPIFGKASSQSPYGEYTVFCSHGSGVFHSDRYCSNNSGYTFHYFALIGSRIPCKRCCSDWPFPNTLPQWYTSIQYLDKNRWRLG